MSSDFFGLNLNPEDFERLLKKDEFEEEPVPLDVFIKDKRYLNLGHDLSPIQSEIVERSTQIYHLPSLVKLHGEEEAARLWAKTGNEVVAQLGKASGKDHTARISIAYAVYKLHCLTDPVGYYGKAAGVYIDFLNLAVNAAQAQHVFFEPLKNLMLRSPYFHEVGFEPRVSELFFFSKPIRCFSGHSESEGWEGHDFMLIILDEIAAFKTDAEIKTETRGRHSASQIYNMSKISVISRFPSVGKVILLSFPRFRDDFIQQKYNSVYKHVMPCSETCNEEVTEADFGSFEVHRVWAIKKCTWEVNPTVKKEDFDNEFARDPIQSKARFMCEPPEMEDAYFRNPDSVREAFKITECPTDEHGTFKPWFNGRDGYPRFIHVDLALKRDRAALAMVHNKGWTWVDTAAGQREKLPVVQLDLLKYWEAGPGEEINFANIRHYIFELNKQFNVAGVWFDKWQSAEMIQTLNQNNIFAEWQAVMKKDYDSLATAFYDGRIHGYKSDETHRLVEEELLRLRLLNNNKIDHPACFVGETRVPLLDGTAPEIKSLVGKEVWTYSAKPSGEIVPGKATAVLSGYTDELVDVVLDNGYVARCTPDHKWMLRDGSYKVAKDLLPGIDRLMPITRNWPVNGGYERLTDLNGTRTLTHRMVAEYMAGRSVGEGEIVHHINEDKTDNSPWNVEIISHCDHVSAHSTSRHHAIHEWREALSAGTVRFNQLDSTKNKRRDYMNSLPKEEFLRRARRSPLFRSDINIDSLRSVAEAENANDAARRLSCGRNVVIRVLKDNGYSTWQEFKAGVNNNHKVRWIIPVKIDVPVPVYDMQVDLWHNFALTGGVFVHNSGYKDGADALAGAVHQCMMAGDIGGEVEISIITTGDEKNHSDEVPPPTIRELSPPVRQKKKPEDLPSELGDWLSGLEMI